MNFATRVERPPQKPLLIFDGDCTFCRKWIARWRQTTGERVDYLELQDNAVVERFPELPREQLELSVHLIEPDGRVTRGAEAVFRSLASARPWPLRLYETSPGFARASELAYGIVARHRTPFSLLTNWFWGTHLERPTHFLVRWLFLRLLGVTYLIAFLSFNAQLPGLIGSHGIVPAQSVMTAISQTVSEHGFDRFHAAPTLCWWSASDSFLRGLCVTGIALSFLVIAGIAPAFCLFLLWLIYLSLAHVSTVFLGYQWDNLLLETGFLAIVFAPMRLWPNLARENVPSRIVLWLLRWLLFRLMFSSGLVKLLSGDEVWRNLMALTFHYETQPLPTSLAWYVHHWPAWFHRASCVVMFVIELVVPFLIFFPRRPRTLAFWAFVLLMLAIALTGNYTFFNLLTCALCVTLLDDFSLMRFAPQKWRLLSARDAPPRLMRWLRNVTLTLLVTVVLTVTSVEMLGMFGMRWSVGNPLVKLSEWVEPFRTINGYGLFAVMTKSRPEIIVEGSNDGENWLAYEFRYKPGDLSRKPPFVAPHQPRLDWQMWFAALGDGRANPWFVNFCFRLLQGQPEVLALMEKNPFPDKPPRFIRARIFDYHFTSAEERRADGKWWQREYKGEYCPPLSLQNFRQ